ncbi:unnamed protein product [Paramecium pentaurelia]|uniref:Uncharacterized protein n=1 Tax=Paramecium pentaurelia TaxID=43138 RepID=A0A8S1SY27_9CILI|nr:unnamed protein product [Paramecium pentaurelia]
MKRRCYFQKYEKLKSPDDLLNRLNCESIKPKFIDYILSNKNNEEKKKMIQVYKQRVCKSLDPLRNIKMDKKTLQEEYSKYLTNPENLAYIRIQNIQQIQGINSPQQSNVNLSKHLVIKYQLINPF